MVALALTVVAASAIGPIGIPFRKTIAVLLAETGLPTLSSFSEREQTIIAEMRLPRVLVGGLAGAALGVSGGAMQGLFRNPLVEPGYVGVSSGAALGAVCALYFGWSLLGPWTLPLSAFAGAALAVMIILSVWQRHRHKSMATLLLLGIGMNALLSAVINLLLASSGSEQELRSIVFWLQGGLEARTWHHVQLIALPILAGCLVLFTFGRDLNAMLLGDEQAANAGINVNRIRPFLLILTSLMTGSAVAVSGIIGFVGLVVPHAVRLVTGPDHRFLLPASALGGAIFLIWADLASRMLMQPVTVQVGVICALIGAPLFMALIMSSRRGGALK